MGQVKLYFPSTKKTVDNFIIGAFQNLDQVLQGVRLALGIKYAALYTTDAKPIYEPGSLDNDDRVLVAASAKETMLPDAPPEWVLYDGEEGDDVDPNTEGYGQEWDTLSDHEKYVHMTSLHEQKPSTRNKLRITRAYKAVEADFRLIDARRPASIPVAEDYATIEQHWGMLLKDLIPASMKRGPGLTPSNKLPAASTVTAISVLSTFTHGQSRLALEVMEEAVALRTQDEEGDDGDPVLQQHDVLSAIEIVYERAGVLPARRTKGKSGKVREREKRRAARERRKEVGEASAEV
ncbi:hypothetical protein G6011_05850 [Alternaria panax]|uniref:Uncharacterized protein n=1 Tax=Alternaria panax TaxID=48097 RepID=A0AAD4I7N9_9PLEO|nr:hypothetical protein G6011_05850 [Alternaria panax]